MQTSQPGFGRLGVRAIQRPLALALSLGLGVAPLAGMAATIIVTSSSDAGSTATCTLRQAIVSMNTGSVAGSGCVNSAAQGFHTNDAINFDATTFPNGGANAITLADDSASTLSISDTTLLIDATANGQVTIQPPSGATQNFKLISAYQLSGALTLKNLNLSNGRNTGLYAPHANGHVTLNNCAVSGNRGNGIIAKGSLVLVNSRASGNLGSGIVSGTYVALFDSTVSGNYGGIAGGGISGQKGVIKLSNSTLSGNSASHGGGIWSQGDITLTNSTLAGNSASYDGGGIYVEGGSVTLTNSTISANGAVTSGGGIQSFTPSGPLAINSIIAGNNPNDLRGVGGPAAGSSGNIIGGNPKLDVLADNGGSTRTMLPLIDSPALDAIPCTNAPATDQRNVARPQGAQCDIGAAEATATELTSPPVIAKVFGVATIPLQGTTSLEFTLTNPNATASLTGVAFLDSLPAGLVVATPSGLTNTCNSAVTADAGSSSVKLWSAPLAGGASCKVTVIVQGTTPGVKNNSVQVTSTNSAHGGIGNTSNATLTVVVSPPTIAKVFGAATIELNANASLTFTVANPNTFASLAGIAFTDSLPAGLVVTTPNSLTNNCGGTATAVAGSASASLSGATLAAGASCTLAVSVTGTTPGVKNNRCAGELQRGRHRQYVERLDQGFGVAADDHESLWRGSD